MAVSEIYTSLCMIPLPEIASGQERASRGKELIGSRARNLCRRVLREWITKRSRGQALMIVGRRTPFQPTLLASA